MAPVNPGLSARLNLPVRLLCGLLTLVPIAYNVVYLSALFWPQQFPAIFHTHQLIPFRAFFTAFLLQMALVAACFAVEALYIVDVHRNDRIPPNRKVIWTLILLFLGIVMLPVYWFLYWRDPPPPLPPSAYPPYPSYPPYPPPPANP